MKVEKQDTLKILGVVLTYVGSAPGWYFPHSTWSTCIDLLPFQSVNCGTVRESKDTVSFKRAVNVHIP